MRILRPFFSALTLMAVVLTLGMVLSCGGGGGGGGGNTTPPPTTGSLTLTVSGLPGSVAASIAISGPGSFNQNATGSGTIQNLSPGSYTITVSNVVNGGSTYLGSPATQAATVNAGQTVIATVTYAPQSISVSVSPSSANLAIGAIQTFTASVSNSTNQAVTWSVDGAGSGSIDAAGTYTAPSTAGTFTVRATSAADPAKSGTASVNVTTNPAIAITLNPTAPSVAVGGALLFSVTVTGSTNQNATWTVIPGSATGSIPTGPTTTATFTAGPAAGSCQVRATSVADPTKSATATVTVTAAGPVIATHPRLLFNAAGKSRLLAKKNANDPSWQVIKARADTLATYTILPYKFATNSQATAGTIYYTYQGEGWLAAALPLAFAYQMTADNKYSSKLIQLAQEMIRAQSDPDNNPPIGLPPIQLDSYYASRNVASTLAFIYDYCYDQLSASLKSQMVTLMNQYYDDVKVNGYQAQNFSSASDGNYFGGHLYGVGMMGYASAGDNARAQEMIEWARIRFDGTPGGTLSPSQIPAAWRSQCFDGGMRPSVALDFNGPNITGNPFKGGFDFQGWSYGSEELGRMIDYMLTVKSATGEDVLSPHSNWFSQILRGEKQALFPNRFMIDPTGDWGGFQGAVVSRGLPTRLAFVLAGTPDGPGAQHFAGAGIATSSISGAEVFPAEEWAEFFFSESSRPSTELTLSPYYTGFSPSYPQGAVSPGGTNGAIPYFIMRSDWTANATWASVQMGAQWWDDHQHFAAGHLIVARGNDYLLVSATDWKTELGGDGKPIYGRSGILGLSLEYQESSLSNTLYFDDFGDFQSPNEIASGGQFAVGIDQVVADELNQDFSYVRSDLSTAYNRAGDPSDTPNRKLDFFYRNFLYLRGPNVFVVYDQVQAKPSANPKGAYKKHIRWHLPNTPTIAGRVAQLNYGESRLFIDTVLPVNANLKVVDEWTNPDPCDGSDPGCIPYGLAKAGTFRIEVRDPLNPLLVPFLTVLQPGSNTSTSPTDTQIASIDGKMIGVEISQAGGVRNIVLFNNQSGQVPPPITSTSYNVPGSGSFSHTILGVVPDAHYSAVFSSGVMHVDQSPTGDKTSSPAGVLHF